MGKSFCFGLSILLLLLLLLVRAESSGRFEPKIVMPSHKAKPVEEQEKDSDGTRWAVLVAGSSGYQNYRHQADVCHAYQILRKGGIKEENIVVMMYDDIAYNGNNPYPGTLINNPKGPNVYAGVPKDYTGDNLTTANFYAVLSGDKNAVTGGSGKVIASKPNDHVFVFYSGHGGPGVLGLPQRTPPIYAFDFIKILKKKHAAGTYKEMVIYIDSCDSASMFEGIMPKYLNIYATTASNVTESSFARYCPYTRLSPPPGYDTCLGDLYSVAWMEDSESHNLKNETVNQQYETVKKLTSNNNKYSSGSHVMEYGNLSIKSEMLYIYQGFNPAIINLPPPNENEIPVKSQAEAEAGGVVNQRDADLIFLWQMYQRSENGSREKGERLKKLTETMRYRKHLDASVELIGTILFGPTTNALNSVRDPGLPLVDDWECLKSMVGVFEMHCGWLTEYGLKHMRAFANICNKDVSKEVMEEASAAACNGYEATHPSQ